MCVYGGLLIFINKLLMMETPTLITLIGTIIATIGGKEAWSYYKKRLDVKAKLRTDISYGDIELRNEIRGMLETQITELKAQVGSLTARILLLEEEREADKKRIANQEIKITLLTERLTSKGALSRGIIDPLEDFPTIDY